MQQYLLRRSFRIKELNLARLYSHKKRKHRTIKQRHLEMLEYIISLIISDGILFHVEDVDPGESISQ